MIPNPMEDEDEFVDAVERPDDEGLDSDHEEREYSEEDVEGFGDDDFGDFAEHTSSVDDEVHEGYDAEREEIPRRHMQIQQSTILEQPPTAFTAPVNFLDFNGESREAIAQEAFEFLQQSIPALPPDPSKPLAPEASERLDNERAMSLWNQLAAPVPLIPPDWKRSRIRRLFLVSLGIPVNLDEILPESGRKKKLVLPSTKPDSPSPTLSGKPPPKAPPFDPVSARHKASVSVLALQNMTAEELLEHIETLKVMNSQASENLTYWLARKDEAVGEKESLEGVIESLVGYTERQRKGTTGIAMVPGRGRTPPPQTVKRGKKR